MNEAGRVSSVVVGEPLLIQAWPKMGGWLKYTPDGSLLVVTGFNGIKLYSSADWAQASELSGHTQAIASGAMSLEGGLLATGSSDTTIRLWALPGGAPLSTLHLHKKTVSALALSPDGKRLASGSYDAKVGITDLANGTATALLKGHKGNVIGLAFSPDSSLLASGALGSDVLIWDGRSGNGAGPLQTLGGHDTVCAPLGWRENRLLTTDYGAVLRVWNVESGEVLERKQLDLPTIGGSAYSPDGRLLAVTAPHTLAFFRTDDWELLDTISLPIKGVYGVTWSPDGARVAVSGADGKVRIYSITVV